MDQAVTIGHSSIAATTTPSASDTRASGGSPRIDGSMLAAPRRVRRCSIRASARPSVDWSRARYLPAGASGAVASGLQAACLSDAYGRQDRRPTVRPARRTPPQTRRTYAMDDAKKRLSRRRGDRQGGLAQPRRRGPRRQGRQPRRRHQQEPRQPRRRRQERHRRRRRQDRRRQATTPATRPIARSDLRAGPAARIRGAVQHGCNAAARRDGRSAPFGSVDSIAEQSSAYPIPRTRL